MSKIVRHSDWGYWDQLDGRTIEHCEPLMVTFPNGEERLITAHVVTTCSQESDHGHVCNISEVRAYWQTEVLGVRVLVPLVGLEARRLR